VGRGVSRGQGGESQFSNINVNYGDIQIDSICNIKFLGSIVDSSLSWKDHINHLVTKLSAASYSIRILSVVMIQESLKMIYFAYVHSVMSYGIIFWGNLTNRHFRVRHKNSYSELKLIKAGVPREVYWGQSYIYFILMTCELH
jgi:hypothetical protein